MIRVSSGDQKRRVVEWKTGINIYIYIDLGKQFFDLGGRKRTSKKRIWILMKSIKSTIIPSMGIKSQIIRRHSHLNTDLDCRLEVWHWGLKSRELRVLSYKHTSTQQIRHLWKQVAGILIGGPLGLYRSGRLMRFHSKRVESWSFQLWFGHQLRHLLRKNTTIPL